MSDHAETFAQVGSKDQIRTEIWRLMDRMGDSLRSIIFADDEDEEIDVEALLNTSLAEFDVELKSRFPKWAVGESVEKQIVVKAEPQHIVKIDEEEHVVFGWFNVTMKADGEPLVDLHDDIIAPAEIEKAAYEFVLEYREGGQDHVGVAKATLVESMVFTGPKMEAMVAKGDGAVSLDIPEGWWWGGFKIHDQEVFDLVKSGDLAMFSIEGTATREEVV